jgi:hypothetical protein
MQSQTDDKGWPYSLGIGRGANNSSQEISLLQNVTKGLGLSPWNLLVSKAGYTALSGEIISK